MISGHDFYAIVKAMVPLYVAMFLAYGSVKWWKIFTADQCSGINRFVALFAIPFLAFHFISMNDPYTMNLRFIAADTLQKIIMLLVLGLWVLLTKSGSLEWLITIFSLSTLPNTLVMGIPLLSAMYGDLTAPLMVQVLVMQCIIWYSLLLFLFEFRAAKKLIMEQFPESGADVVSVKVDADVVSLNDQDFLETEAEIGDDGKLHVKVRKSNAARKSFGSLSGAEIYSISSSAIQTPTAGSRNNQSDFYSITAFHSGRPSTDLYSVQPPIGPTPSTRNRGGSRIFADESYLGFIEGEKPPQMPLQQSGRKKKANYGVQMYPRSSSAPTSVSKGGRFRTDLRELMEQSSRVDEHGAKEIRMLVSDQPPNETEEFQGEMGGDKERMKQGLDSTAEQPPKTVEVPDEGTGKQLPSASVMIRLILMMVWRKLSRNPNTYASIMGLIWSLVSFRWHLGMPKVIGDSITLMSNAGLGMAMFSLGLFMALQPEILACGRSKAVLGMIVKFLIGPMVMAVASAVVGLHGKLLHVSIVQATLCEGIVPFVFAKEYNVHPTILSTAVIFGMLITVPITLCYYIILEL